MHKRISYIVTLVFITGLCACSKDATPTSSKTGGGINIVYFSNGAPMFTGKATAQDSIRQINIFPFSGTEFATSPDSIKNGFYYTAVTQNGVNFNAYVLRITAIGGNFSSSSGMDTAKIGIIWNNGRTDTLVCINSIMYSGTPTPSLVLFQPVKCVYNGVVEYDILDNPRIENNISTPGVAVTIGIEK